MRDEAWHDWAVRPARRPAWPVMTGSFGLPGWLAGGWVSCRCRCRFALLCSVVLCLQEKEGSRYSAVTIPNS